MTTQRPNYMKTLRQGSAGMAVSPAARSCAGPRLVSGVSGYQEPAGRHEGVPWLIAESDLFLGTPRWA
jgi:hypothetical protein